MGGIVLALDCAPVTGIAFDDGDAGGARPRAFTFSVPRATGNDRDGWDYSLTFAEFFRQLQGLVGVVKPALVAIEAPLNVVGAADKIAKGELMTREMTVRIQFGLVSLAETAAGLAGVECAEHTVQRVRRHFVGNAFGTKKDVMARCRQLGWAYRNDNEADAIALWSFTKALRDPKWAPRSTPLFAREGAAQ